MLRALRVVLIAITVLPIASTVAVAAPAFVWPIPGVCRITQYFEGSNWPAQHTGLDIAGSPGVQGYRVVAAESGTARAAWRNDYGNHVVVDHADGYQTLYAHLKELGTSGSVARDHDDRLSGKYGQQLGTTSAFRGAT